MGFPKSGSFWVQICCRQEEKQKQDFCCGEGGIKGDVSKRSGYHVTYGQVKPRQVKPRLRAENPLEVPEQRTGSFKSTALDAATSRM